MERGCISPWTLAPLTPYGCVVRPFGSTMKEALQKVVEIFFENEVILGMWLLVISETRYDGL